MINFRHLEQRAILNSYWRQERIIAADLPIHFNSRHAALQINEALLVPENYSATVATLRQFAAKQFDPSQDWNGEISGRVSYNQSALCFQSFVSIRDANVAKCYRALCQTGEQMAARILTQEVGDYIELIKRSDRAVTCAHIEQLENALFEYACAEVQPETTETIDRALLKTVLESVTRVQLSEFQSCDPDFRGTFHLHPNGTPANQADIEQSFHLGVPVLVVAAQKDFPHALNLDILAAGEIVRSVDLRQPSYTDEQSKQPVRGPLKLVRK